MSKQDRAKQIAIKNDVSYETALDLLKWADKHNFGKSVVLSVLRLSNCGFEPYQIMRSIEGLKKELDNPHPPGAVKEREE